MRERNLEVRSKSSKIYLILQRKQRIEWKGKNERNNIWKCPRPEEKHWVFRVKGHITTQQNKRKKL